MDNKSILAEAKRMCKNTMMETLNIELTDIGEGFAEATMPVNSKVHQPAGLLHGGASAALAESLGSMASYILVRDEGKAAVGLEINANHIKSLRKGTITARANLLHRGGRTHVWDIKITGPDGELISVCRLTNMIIDAKGS